MDGFKENERDQLKLTFAKHSAPGSLLQALSIWDLEYPFFLTNAALPSQPTVIDSSPLHSNDNPENEAAFFGSVCFLVRLCFAPLHFAGQEP